MTLRQGATIVTGSIRRARQLLKQRPDLNIVDIRDYGFTNIQEAKLPSYVALIEVIMEDYHE